MMNQGRFIAGSIGSFAKTQIIKDEDKDSTDSPVMSETEHRQTLANHSFCAGMLCPKYVYLICFFLLLLVLVLLLLLLLLLLVLLCCRCCCW